MMKGFTLIEFTMVLAFIAIVAAGLLMIDISLSAEELPLVTKHCLDGFVYVELRGSGEWHQLFEDQHGTSIECEK